MSGTEPGGRLFYSTGEASRLVGVPAHTLRYWEKRLRLATYRSPGGRRLYRAADLDVLRKVSALLKEGYGLGAMRGKLRNGDAGTPPGARALRSLRNGLRGVADILAGVSKEEGE